jgi:hypothetical protein
MRRLWGEESSEAQGQGGQEGGQGRDSTAAQLLQRCTFVTYAPQATQGDAKGRQNGREGLVKTCECQGRGIGRCSLNIYGSR